NHVGVSSLFSTPGGPHEASGSVGSLQAGQEGGSVVVMADVLGNPVAIGQSGLPVLPAGVSPFPVGTTIPVQDMLTLDLIGAALQISSVGVPLDFSAMFKPIAWVLLGGYIGTGPNGGNSASGSPGP